MKLKKYKFFQRHSIKVRLASLVYRYWYYNSVTFGVCGFSDQSESLVDFQWYNSPTNIQAQLDIELYWLFFTHISYQNNDKIRLTSSICKFEAIRDLNSSLPLSHKKGPPPHFKTSFFRIIWSKYYFTLIFRPHLSIPFPQYCKDFKRRQSSSWENTF